MNHIAPEGQIYVCMACGKRSLDEYGYRALDRMWDASCMLNAMLCYDDETLILKNGRVVDAKVVE